MKSAVKLICVPHLSQKLRSASADDAYVAGAAPHIRTCSRRYIAHAIAGAAPALRHIEQ
jgi:hypothetical protein